MSMRANSFVLVLASAVLGACAAPGQQKVTQPAIDSAVAANRCRVIIARENERGTGIRNVRIVDNGVEIGWIGGDEYLCWDRPAERGLGQAFFEGLDPKYGSVEQPFDLPREAGTTTWLVIRIGALQRPQISALSPAEGRALVARRKPAASAR